MGLDIEDQNAFVTGAAGASFVLNNDLAQYLDELLRRAIDMPFLRDELANAPTEGRKKLEAKYLAERRWMREQTSELEKKVKPLMQLKG